MRSGTTWDNILEEVRSENLLGKKVAVFGCGDSISYGDYFCDAIEEIHSAFAKSGAMWEKCFNKLFRVLLIRV